MPVASSAQQKNINLLNRKVSHLRAYLYLSLAILGLFTCLSVYWIYNYSSNLSVETFYSVPTIPPKAALYLSPQSGNYKVGDEFAVDVLVNTQGNNVNTVAAYLSYPKDKIKAVSIDFSDSIFNMPVEQGINEKDGKLRITIGIPTPGIKTNNGKVATVHFKALGKENSYAENIYFDFTKGTSLYSGVFLNDNQGTNILDVTRGAKVFIE